MEQAVIAIGSNLGDRHAMVGCAGEYLSKLSGSSLKKSSIWESEPIGGAKYSFFNAVAEITTSLHPTDLLRNLKEFELASGREKNHARWSPRILDLDIITYGNLVIEKDNLIIPHPEYKKRLFVLLPLLEISPDYSDSVTGEHLDVLIQRAPKMEIRKTDLEW